MKDLQEDPNAVDAAEISDSWDCRLIPIVHRSRKFLAKVGGAVWGKQNG